VDLRQLEIFAKVAELGSFSRAAEALCLTHLATHKERSRSPLAEAFRAFVEADAV